VTDSDRMWLIVRCLRSAEIQPRCFGAFPVHRVARWLSHIHGQCLKSTPQPLLVQSMFSFIDYCTRLLHVLNDVDRYKIGGV